MRSPGSARGCMLHFARTSSRPPPRCRTRAAQGPHSVSLLSPAGTRHSAERQPAARTAADMLESLRRFVQAALPTARQTAACRRAGLCSPGLTSRGQLAALHRSPDWETVQTCSERNESGAAADSLAGPSREDPRAGFRPIAADGGRD